MSAVTASAAGPLLLTLAGVLILVFARQINDWRAFVLGRASDGSVIARWMAITRLIGAALVVIGIWKVAFALRGL